MVSQSCPDICKCAMHTQLWGHRGVCSWTGWSKSCILDPPVSHLFQSYSQRDRGQWCLCIHSKGPGGSWTGWCIFCIFYPPTSHPPPLQLAYFILTSHKSSQPSTFAAHWVAACQGSQMLLLLGPIAWSCERFLYK